MKMQANSQKGLLIRRLHIIKPERPSHIFAEITFGKNRPVSLLHVFNGNATVLANSTSLFECEAIYHAHTDSQFRTSRKLDFDNSDFQHGFLRKSIINACGESRSAEAIAAETQTAIIRSIPNDFIFKSFESATAIHSQRRLYAVGKDGKADYDRQSLFIVWSRESNAFVAHFECAMGEYGLIGLHSPKFFAATSEPMPIEKLRGIKDEACLNSVSSGKFECLMTAPFDEAILKRCLDAYMSESGNFSQRECVDPCQTFSEGLVYRSTSVWNSKHPMETFQSDLAVFDDFGNVQIANRDSFMLSDC